MVTNNCHKNNGRDQSVSYETCNSGLLFENLIWLSTEETARYLRKSVPVIGVLAYRQSLKAGKFWWRLFFRREKLGTLIETPQLIGGLKWQY